MVMAIMRARMTGPAGRKRDPGPSARDPSREWGGPRVSRRRNFTYAFVSCVRANTDPEGENQERGIGVVLIGWCTSTGCGGRPTSGESAALELSFTVYTEETRGGPVGELLDNFRRYLNVNIRMRCVSRP